MKSITSRENSLYKELKQLASSSQARRKSGRTLLDGVHLCETYWQHLGKPQICIVAESSAQHHEVSSILALCEAAHAQCICLPDALYHALSQVEHGVGLMFIVATPQPVTPEVLQESAVMLDNLQDPGNLGSILRSAAAAGIRHVFCSPGTAFAWSPKVMRAGMGAHFLLNIVENADLHQLISKAAIPVLATSSHTTQTIYQAELNRPIAWLFGHEGQGVADDLVALATDTVTIPQRPEIESLNVAASAAICFFEQVRQSL
ncbi:RNA methyltransferase [Undibacterium sp. Jales W-56]|uniref:TrmH family RNA methyltransferase n=1 Tax=Undibacterium sp. Jales W-56 TaxID=2897325 RepID=UPI0021CF5ABE|nr:RNA methyltransferase [Undibacterium sp. Jales W-56]MCU6433644.1 RNA methyltransferase [Undibacterium sp. Jales W-56]